MEGKTLALLEMLIVFGFALGWGVLELVALRLDRKREAAREQQESEKQASRQ